MYLPRFFSMSPFPSSLLSLFLTSSSQSTFQHHLPPSLPLPLPLCGPPPAHPQAIPRWLNAVPAQRSASPGQRGGEGTLRASAGGCKGRGARGGRGAGAVRAGSHAISLQEAVLPLQLVSASPRLPHPARLFSLTPLRLSLALRPASHCTSCSFQLH